MFTILTRQMLFPLEFYKKAKFHGSKGDYNYRIERKQDEETGEERFLVSLWEGPECYDASKKEKQVREYSFTEEGMEEILKVLNEL